MLDSIDALCFFIKALHRLEMFVKFRLMGATGQVEYVRLNDEKAAEIGSEMLGEAFLYGVAASYIMYEYAKSVSKGNKKDETTSDSIAELQEQVAKLNTQLDSLSQSLEKLNQHTLNSSNKK